MGILLQVTDAGDGFLRVRGDLPHATTINLWQGSNFVGYPVVNDYSYSVADVKAATGNKVTSVECPDDNVLPDNYILKRGIGYCFEVSDNCTWTINNGVNPHLPIRIDSNADFDAAHGVTGGNGTVWAPWSIENWEINGTGYGYCVYIGNTTQYFTVRNCTLYNASGAPFGNAGLYLFNVVNGTAANNKMTNNFNYGVYIAGNSRNNTVIGNNVSANGATGLGGHGILVEQSTFNIIASNTVNDNEVSGIMLYNGTNNNTVINNNLYSNTDWGIYSTYSNGNLFTGNNISFTISSGGPGVKGIGIGIGDINPPPIDYSDNNVLFNNTIWNNTYGVYLKVWTVGNRVYHNNIINNTYQAYDETANFWDDGYPSGGNFWSDYIGNDIFSGLSQDIPGSDGFGDTPYIIDLDSTDYYPLAQQIDTISPVILFTTPIDGATNIGVSAGTYVIQFNERMNTSAGLVLTNLPGVTWIWSGNGLWLNGTYGALNYGTYYYINLTGGGFIDLAGNPPSGDLYKCFNSVSISYKLPIRINSNADFDIAHGVSTAGNNGTVWAPWVIENWEINGAGYGYCIYVGNTTQHFIVRNCTLFNASGAPSMNAGLYLNNTANGIASGNTMANCTNYGVCISYNSYNNTIEGNNISQNLANGILVEASTFNTIANNTINDNEGAGISLYNAANNNSAINNTVYSNSDRGIYLTKNCNGNIFSSNNISFTSNSGIGSEGGGIVLGVYTSSDLDISDNNIIVNNTISNNTHGIYITKITPAYGNRIYHNNIINNTNQAYDGTANLWNDSYPSGGNFWSDYTGVDNYSGLNQNLNGSDGIGDTPYTNITGAANQDRYPLMTLFNGTGTSAADTTPPNSTVDTISPYWRNSGVNITATANDTLSTVANVTLWFRFGTTNASLGAFAPFASDNSTPFYWPFNFPNGEGYYQLYTIANDTLNNTEPAPASADAACGYDATLPNITLNSPQNSTIFRSGPVIDFSISDTHLASANYSVNGGTNITLDPPYDVNTTGWSDGDKAFEVKALDLAGNIQTRYFYFTIDEIAPTITLTIPTNNSNEIPVTDGITIGFSEAMDTASVESAFGIATLTNNTAIQYAWGTANKTLFANFSKALEPGKDYVITLGTGASDLVGNHLASQLYLAFSTWTDTDIDGIPDSTDSDDDGDGVADSSDAFPLDPLETLDTDSDGIGNNNDTDDDGDGVLDEFDQDPLDPNVGAAGSNTWIYIVVVVVVIVIVLLVIVYLMRGRAPAGFEQAGEEAKTTEEQSQAEEKPDEETEEELKEEEQESDEASEGEESEPGPEEK
jgi:parallel beta-helix repeat protein